MSQGLVLVGVVLASSIVLVALAAVVLRLPFGDGRAALSGVLEFAGLWVFCLTFNAALGTAVIVLLRHLAGVFISVYVLNDLVLVILSALQAAGFKAWMAARRR